MTAMVETSHFSELSIEYKSLTADTINDSIYYRQTVNNTAAIKREIFQTHINF